MTTDVGLPTSLNGGSSAGWALAMVLWAASVVAAQPVVVLNDVGIELWPEYDRAEVLVIYHATLAPEVKLPIRMVLRIPAGAGSPHAVAERSADGQLMTVPHERTVEADMALIAFTATQPNVQLEYYDPALVRDGAKRTFAFTWPGDVEVRNLSISVQQPKLAQNFATVPASTSTAVSAEGLTHYASSRGPVKPGQTVGVQVSYEKATDELSVAPAAPAPAAPTATAATPTAAPAPANAGGARSRTVPLVLAALVVISAAIGVWLMMKAQPATGGRSAAPQGPAAPGARGTRTVRFCPGCGSGVAADHRFCPHCGRALTA